jgi:membrane protease YdiL (CAAX protease family)
VQTAPVVRPKLEEPAHPDPSPPPRGPAARDSLADQPPGFGRWPWWTPIVALVAGLAVLAGPVLLLESVDFPFQATVGEGLFAAIMLGFAWLLMSRFGGRPRAADLGFRATPSRAAVGWVVVARFTYGICAAIYIVGVGGVTSNVPIRPLGDVDTLPAVDVAIAAVVLAPLFEEIFFRGFMYASLRGKLPAFWASLVTGTLFAAVHPLYGGAAWNLVPVLALAGIAMCLLYERTGSLWPAIAFHLTMNAGILAVITGRAAPTLALIGGLGFLFLLAPWRFFSRGRRAPAAPVSA